MSKNIKYKVSMGLAFNEEKEMQMLSQMAKKGWIFYSFTKLMYKFKRADARDLIYCVDTHEIKDGEDELYFDIFKNAGWAHVCSYGDSIHYFSALPGTKPIYSDRETFRGKYEEVKRDVDKVAIGSAISMVFFVVLNLLFQRFWDNGIVIFITVVAGGLSFGFLIGMIATGIALKKRIKGS